MPVVEHGSIIPVRLSGRNLVSDQISENFARVDRSTIPNLRGQMLSAFSSADRTPYPFAVTVRPDTGSRRHTDFRHHKSACRRRSPSFLSRSFLFSDARTARAVCTGLLFSSANQSRRTSSLFPSVRPYRAGVQWRYGCTFFLRYRCFCCPDCCKFSNFRWQITADSSSVSRSGLAYTQTSPAEHSQTFPMAAHGLLRSFQIPPSSHKWVPLCNTRKWERNQPKCKSSGWFIQPELG